MIDDEPIEESGSDGEDSDAGPKKRKKSDDELDDRLEEEDYDLIEENLGVKVARVRIFYFIWEFQLILIVILETDFLHFSDFLFIYELTFYYSRTY